MKRGGVSIFWTAAGVLLAAFAAVRWVIPFVSREATGLPFPLPVPGALAAFYLALAVVAIFLYVTSSEETLRDFLAPPKKLLLGGYGVWPRNLVLIALPVIVGRIVFTLAAPAAAPPSVIRMQHPSSNFPKRFEAMKNPLEAVSDAEIDDFVRQAKEGTLEFDPAVQGDVEAWRELNADAGPLSFIPTPPWQRFISALEKGEVERGTARAALREKDLFEGRALYAVNCRPCHGSSAAGDGPMARGLSLKPVSFADSGTIETLVEGYVFWRVESGGPGLPPEATPWDSAMPAWERSLGERERWKIILAEYDLAGKHPRRPESHD